MGRVPQEVTWYLTKMEYDDSQKRNRAWITTPLRRWLTDSHKIKAIADFCR